MKNYIDFFLDGKNLYDKFIDEACLRYALIRTEMDILLFLTNNPQYDTATEIVRYRHLSKSHVSKSVYSLQQRGYLTASYHGNDRRTIHLKLCEAAQEAVEDGKQAQKKFVDVLYHDFTAEEMEQFCQFLNRVQINAQSYLAQEGKKHGDTI